MGETVTRQCGSVQGNSEAGGSVHVGGRALIEHYAKVSGEIKVSGHVIIQKGVEIKGKGLLSGCLVVDSRDVNMPWGPGIK